MQTKINKETLNEMAKMSKQATDSGRLIEAGWLGLRMAFIPDNASDVQIADMKKAFFSGSLHLFSSLMCILDSGKDATNTNNVRMTQIHNELTQFFNEFIESMN